MCVKLIFGVTLRLIFRTLDINKNVKNGSIKSRDQKIGLGIDANSGNII